MTDLLSALADLGRPSVAALWVPVALWTALALAAEAALRLSRANAALGLPLRGAVLAALPVSVGLSAIVRSLAPGAASAVAAMAPIARLPEIVVGAPPAPIAAASGPPLVDALVGVAVLLAAVGGGIGLVRLAAEAVRLRRLRRALPPAPPDAQDCLDRARTRLGIGRPIGAVAAPPGVAPFTVGWRRPVVAIPLDLDASALDAVLTHELAHVARGDFAWHVAQRAVVSVFAAHPLVHVVGRGLDLDRERAADAAVLTAHPGARRAYADLLLSYASLPPPPFALGAAPGASSLKSRIDAMTRPLPPARLRQFLRLGRAVGAAALVLVTGLAVAAAAPTASVAPSSTVASAERVVEGTVVDADSRAPIVGASVQVVGTDIGAATDREGRYRLDAPTGEQTIQVSVAGYETQYVGIEDGQTELNVALTIRNVPPPTPDAPAPPPPPPPEPEPTEPDIFEVAEVQPELIGGLEGLQGRVFYPPDARAANVQGQVVLQFVVNEQGAVEDARVLRSPDDRLSEAALAAVRASRFTPGRQRGEPVKVRFAVPVTFRLPSDQ